MLTICEWNLWRGNPQSHSMPHDSIPNSVHAQHRLSTILVEFEN